MLIASTYLHYKMRNDEKIIDKILNLEVDRKSDNSNFKQSTIVMYSKIDKDLSQQVREILKKTIELKGNYNALNIYIQRQKNETWLLKNFNTKNIESYPEKIKFYSLREQLINHIAESLSKVIYDGKYKHLRKIKPILDNIDKQENGSLIINIKPFRNIELDSNIQIFIRNEKTEINKNPFFYEGDIKDIKCVTKNPITKETWTYEGK